MENKINLKKLVDKYFVWGVALILFILPFFWFKPGELDLGGDSGRIYLHSSYKYLKNVTLFPLNLMGGLNAYLSRRLIIPFALLLAGTRKVLFDSPYLLNNFLNGITLSIGFLATYKFFDELNYLRRNKWKKYIMAFCSLFFVISPMTIYDFQRANFHVYLIFLYPLILYFFLRYLHTQKLKFILFISLLTFFFACNFSFTTIPWLLSFLPLGFLFLFVYACSTKKIAIYLKGMGLAILFSLLLNFFHIYPLFDSLFDTSSDVHRVTFSDKLGNSAMGYFMRLYPVINSIYSFTNQPQYTLYGPSGNKNRLLMYDYGVKYLPVFSVYAFVAIVGLLYTQKLSKRSSKMRYFIWFLYLVTFFFSVGNLGKIPTGMYEKLFIYVPGFRMFRHFFGKFHHVYTFFYAFVLYLSLDTVSKLFETSKKTQKLFSYLLSFMFLLTVVSGIPILGGGIVNSSVPGSNKYLEKVPIPIEMDPKYLSFMDYLEKLNGDFKIMSLPFSTETYQVLKGKSGGTYLGPSTIAVFAGRTDFNGFGSFYNLNLPGTFYNLFYESPPERMRRFLGFLNIGYIVHNYDDFLYKYFGFAYSEFVKMFPTQDSITKMIMVLGGKLVHEEGTYRLFQLPDYYLPHIYIPEQIIFHENNLLDFFVNYAFEGTPVRLGVFLEGLKPQKLREGLVTKIPKILFYRVNPTKYKIKVSGATDPYALILGDTYSDGWKLYYNRMPSLSDYGEAKVSHFDGDVTEGTHKSLFLYGAIYETKKLKEISVEQHHVANGYSNAWVVSPNETEGAEEYELVLEYLPHRDFYSMLAVSAVSFGAIVFYLLFVVVKESGLMSSNLTKKNRLKK